VPIDAVSTVAAQEAECTDQVMGQETDPKTAGIDDPPTGEFEPLPAYDDGMFKNDAGRKAFLFRHGLSGHPLFDLPSLIQLADRLAKHDAVYWSTGAVGASDRWEAGTEGRRPLMATLENIDRNNSLVMLKSVVHDPIFGPVIRQTLERIIDLTGGPALHDDLIGVRATILIASPHRITAYHIDAVLNFLVQISGKKLFRVYDGSDRTLLTSEELERYFAGDANGAVFRAERLADAAAFALDAGLGAHVPPMWPHWAENGDDISVAVSFNYDLHSIERVARIHKVNRRLRQLGLRPQPPGAGRTVDRAKLALYGAYAAGLRPWNKAPSEADGSVWQPPLRS
jgi:hypothetical protein